MKKKNFIFYLEKETKRLLDMKKSELKRERRDPTISYDDLFKHLVLGEEKSKNKKKYKKFMEL